MNIRGVYKQLSPSVKIAAIVTNFHGTFSMTYLKTSFDKGSDCSKRSFTYSEEDARVTQLHTAQLYQLLMNIKRRDYVETAMPYKTIISCRYCFHEYFVEYNV